jgi:hypothetical protein
VNPKITFKNETANPVDLYFVNLSGNEIKMGTIAAGTTLTQSTAASQNWRLKEAATGTVVANYTATAETTQTYTIAAPARPEPPATTTTITITPSTGVIKLDPNRMLPPSGPATNQPILSDCQSSIFCNEFVEVVSCEGYYEYLFADRFYTNCPEAGDGRFHAALRKFEDKVQADLRGIKTGKTSRYLKTNAAALDTAFAPDIAAARQNRERAFRRYDQENTSGLYPASIRQAQADLQQAQADLDSTIQVRDELKAAINGLATALNQPLFRVKALTYTQQAVYGAALFAALLEIIESNQRTPDEQLVYDWFVEQVRKADIRQAIAKKDRYNEWNNNKCAARYWTPEKEAEFAARTDWVWRLQESCIIPAFVGQEEIPKEQIERYAALDIAPSLGVEMGAFAFSYASGVVFAKAAPDNVQKVAATINPEAFAQLLKAAYDSYETIKPALRDVTGKAANQLLKISPERLKLFIKGNKVAGQAVSKVVKVTSKTAINVSKVALKAAATKLPTVLLKIATTVGKIAGPLLIVADAIYQSIVSGMLVIDNANYIAAINNGPEVARNAKPDIQAMINNSTDVQYLWYLFNEAVAPEPDYEDINESTALTPPAVPEVTTSAQPAPTAPPQGGGGTMFGGRRIGATR